MDLIQNACIRKGVTFKSHTSDNELTEEEKNDYFIKPITNHIVLGVKGFYRRANLIPNSWKLRIGATHELFTKKVDNNVQIQGLTGRMTGYWRNDIESGHKTGPHRTSIEAIKQYEQVYENPFGENSYNTSGFSKKKGRVTANATMLSPKHIKNLVVTDLPDVKNSEFERGYKVFDTQEENEEYAKKFGAKRISNYDTNIEGFKMCSTTSLRVHSLEEIMKFTKTLNEGSNMDKKLSDLKVDEYAYRRYVCYKDISNKSTECFMTIWVRRIKDPSS